MPRKRQQNEIRVQGHDERNTARLALALAQNRIPETLQSWEKELTVDALGMIRVKCVARADAVVPHGLDNDIIVGLVNAYVEQGLPTTGIIQLSAYRLLTLAGLRVGGKQYSELLESLRRLQGSTFAITESWFDGRQHQWVSEEFSIISSFARIDATEAEMIGQLRADTMLEIQLARAITRSVRSGHLRPLDLEFYSQLSQPMVRTLYRSLEERRAPAGKVATHIYVVSTRLWGEHLGMQGWRLDKIRRALEPAHRELLENQYLIDVVYTGRGESQTISYHFGKVAAPVNAELVALLTTNGLNTPTAMKIAQELPERIVSTVSAYRKVVEANRVPVKNQQGLLIDMLRNPSKYSEFIDNPEIFNDTPEKPYVLPKINDNQDNHQFSNQPEGDELSSWKTLSPKMLQKRAISLLKISMKNHLSTEEINAIINAIQNGKIDPLEVVQKLTRSAAQKGLSTFSQELLVLID